jgi:hypothetical protein
MGIYKTNLTSPYFIDAPATSQESQSCICVLGVAILPDVTSFRLDFETALFSLPVNYLKDLRDFGLDK